VYYRSLMEAYLPMLAGLFQACTFAEDSFLNVLHKAVDVNERYKIWDYVRSSFPALGVGNALVLC